MLTYNSEGQTTGKRVLIGNWQEELEWNQTLRGDTDVPLAKHGGHSSEFVVGDYRENVSWNSTNRALHNENTSSVAVDTKNGPRNSSKVASLLARATADVEAAMPGETVHFDTTTSLAFQSTVTGSPKDEERSSQASSYIEDVPITAYSYASRLEYFQSDSRGANAFGKYSGFTMPIGEYKGIPNKDEEI